MWITGGKDYLQIIGPTNTYKLKVANAADDLGEWSTLLSKSFEEHIHRLKTTKDQELQLERAANMNVTDSVRFGSFVFANTASYSGWWVDGMVLFFTSPSASSLLYSSFLSSYYNLFIYLFILFYYLLLLLIT